MTKQDYELIAGTFRSCRTHRPDSEAGAAWLEALDNTAANLADKLAADNPRFDHSRFVAACKSESSQCV